MRAGLPAAPPISSPIVRVPGESLVAPPRSARAAERTAGVLRARREEDVTARGGRLSAFPRPAEKAQPSLALPLPGDMSTSSIFYKDKFSVSARAISPLYQFLVGTCSARYILRSARSLSAQAKPACTNMIHVRRYRQIVLYSHTAGQC